MFTKSIGHKIWVVFLLTVLARFESNAQDPVFSQFYNSHLLLNSALAGQSHGPMFQLNYRNQWPGLDQIYTTYSLSYDQYLHKIKSGIGFNIISDNAGNGTLKNTSITGFYSYKIKIKKDTYIKGGLEAGFSNMSLDWNKLVFGDAINSRFGTIGSSAELQGDNLNQNFISIGAGMVLSSPYYYAGLSFKNLNSPDISFLTFGNNGFIPTRISIHGGTKFVIREGNKNTMPTLISPNIMFQRQGGYNQVNFGSYLEVNRFLGGLWYRHSVFNGDAFIMSFGVRQDFLKVTYSFDYTTSQLGIRQGGSHEMSVVLNFESLYPKKSDYNDCFAIFR